MGGDVVATLPLLASFLSGIGEEPFEFSPYSPASRLMWNELYVDPTRVPELRDCHGARALLESPAFKGETQNLRALPLVDYRRQMVLKRQVLGELSRHLFGRGDPARLECLGRFTREHPLAEEYARFRATGEKQGAPWPSWPPSARQGTLRGGSYDEDTAGYHLYVQWLAHQQIRDLSSLAREKGCDLYLDLPLGVHPHGFDVWKWPDLFASRVSAGAPPDMFFARGQNWGFPPLHPDMLRRQRYGYFIACIRHHLRHAGTLRMDHIMSLHRLFWIPTGMEARQGTYVRYPADELYAILSLESHRNGASIVGENLGTVPAYANADMARHGIHGMYVVPFKLSRDAGKPLHPVPTDAVASLNTHDLPTFSSYWRGADIEDRQAMGQVDEAGARRQLEERRALRRALVSFLRREGRVKEKRLGPAGAHRAVMALLAESRAGMVMVNLEDLWLETRPQNVPGTQGERPNWRSKARYSFEEFSTMTQVLDVLAQVARLRASREACV
jgi:4-alpha-glucanotransferase